MKVLFYNWADPMDPRRRGGGIGVYQRNLASAMTGVDAQFLSSGLVHDFVPGPPRVTTLADGQYTVVNSGVLAPSHADFAGASQISHPATKAAICRFLRDTGPWQAIHFNTLEGVPADILSVKEKMPATRFILSLHNYYPFCPQVNFWHREIEACSGPDNGTRCTTCLPSQPDARAIRTAYALESLAARCGIEPGTLLFDRGLRPALSRGWRLCRRRAQAGATAPPLADHFTHRHARFVDLINRYCDTVLCVSRRVSLIAEAQGIDPDRLSVLRIGTPEADAWARTTPKPAFATSPLRLAYLGYMRRDKGFVFLLDTLENMPDALARRLDVVIAARGLTSEYAARLNRLRPRLAGLTLFDGYDHAQLDQILRGVDAGIVPVLWEDNLPQVAIEMHARHIPLITADKGGARELGNAPEFIFRAGDAAGLTRIICAILNGHLTPAQYWRRAEAPVTMAEHARALSEIYRGTPPSRMRRTVGF